MEIFLKKMNLKKLLSISDFPIEIFLTTGKANYLNSKIEGKKAHQARLLVDNFILSQSSKISLEFFKSCHNAGIGRGMVYFLKNEK